MPTNTIFATTNTTGRGFIQANNEEWDEAVAAEAGSVSAASSNSLGVRAGFVEGRGGGQFFVSRAYAFFNTSTISGTVTSATVKVVSQGSNGGNIRMYKGTAFGNNGSSLSTDDFPAVTSTLYSTADYGELNWGTGQLRSFSCNSTAVSFLNSNSYLNVCFRNDKDVDEDEPSEDFYAGVNFQTSGTNRIQLEVVTAATGYGNQVITVASSDISNVIGVATANIANVIGVS
tara:strand:+ start:1962 stop:2654 length:693 start_codon:yes stop_codon:yes gene_type:complete